MDTISQLVKNLWTGFSALPVSRQLTLLIVVAVTLASVWGLVYWVNQADYKVLFTNLSTEDASGIVTKLQEKKIPYELSGGGNTISVPSGKVTEVRLELASLGLPQGGGVGFEIFDQKNLGATEFEQQLNYRRALQGELARTISSLEEIEQCRVHLALPRDSLFVEEQKKTTASVTIKLKGVRNLRPDQVEGIAHLVASSVEGLDPADVMVVDGKGNILSRKQDHSRLGKMTASQVEYRVGLEGDMANRIQTMLEKVVGQGKAVVRVAADLDFSVTEKTEEIYDSESPVIRSTQKQTEKSTPSAGAVNPRSAEEKLDEVINYEINKTVNKTVMPVGEIQKLSIAVLVDGTYVKDKKGEEVYQPRDKKDLDNIAELVRKSAGFSAVRGDQVVVTNMPFRTSAEDEFHAPIPWTQHVSGFTPYFKYLVILGVTIFLFLFVLKPILGLVADLGRSQPAEPRQAGADQPSELRGQAATPMLASPLKERPMNETELTRRLADADAKRFAELLRNWIR
ncbi:MAG: flagellar M-ring protein FliF [Deltaproteobacteria bacterium]|nr:flagellar M-ring protein FliF [Deltaproteobacteria bacterium]